MIYGSVCSGIEAASVAWRPLGWTPSFLSEIEPFPRAVLAHHHPTAPLHGDFTTIQAGQYDAINVLVGGTPCQSFSVAGLRGGMADERGNLALAYLHVAHRLRPRWLVWENVPGVLSSNGGRDFGSFLGGLVKLGYGFAYRMLDAQYFGLAQRRKRVFVVGYLGDWRPAAAVLFEPESLRGHPAPRCKTGQSAARTLSARASAGGGLGTDFECSGGLIAHTLRGDGFDASEDDTGRGTPLVVTQPFTLAIRGRDGGHDLEYRQDGTANALLMPGGGRGGIGVGAVAYALETAPALTSNPYGDHESREGLLVAFSCKDHGADAGDVAPTLRAMGHADSHANGGGQVAVAGQSAVRRLTPRECERLQGFPDDYTAITFRGKPAADGNRYRALGNSMAVPCMAWIGKRIAAVDGSL